MNDPKIVVSFRIKKSTILRLKDQAIKQKKSASQFVQDLLDETLFQKKSS